MNKLLLVLLLGLIQVQAQVGVLDLADPVFLGGTVNDEVGGGGFSWDFTETFEGSETDSQSVAGYDNTGWTSSNVANDPNYATSPAPLDGSYSAWFGNAGRTLSRTVSPTGSTQTVCFRWNWDGTWGSFAESGCFRSGTTYLGGIDQRASETLRIKHGTVTSSDLNGWTTATTWYVWFEYTPSSGANDGVLRLYRSTTATKPASPNLEITTGTATDTPDNFRINGVSSSSVYDNICYEDGVGGDAP
jgi:hypothetical protein